MTTGPRCNLCDTPLVTDGVDWSCPDGRCPKHGLPVMRDDIPEEA
jgi:hypothetical protein